MADKNYASDDSYVAVELTLDDGSTLECAVLTVFDVSDKNYVALLPMEEADGIGEDEVFLYAYDEGEEGPELSDIEDDDEYNAAADAFEAWLAQQNFED